MERLKRLGVVLLMASVVAAAPAAQAAREPPVAVAGTAQGAQGAPTAQDPAEAARAANLARCEKYVETHRVPAQGALNIGFGALAGGGIGALIGSLFGFPVWGASLGSLYGGVVGHFSGAAATTAIEQQMLEGCLRGAR